MIDSAVGEACEDVRYESVKTRVKLRSLMKGIDVRCSVIAIETIAIETE
jgi:hypothetical protein